MKILPVSVAAALTLVFGAASTRSHAEVLQVTGWEAVACTVSGGPNNGKSGLITQEDGDVYCEGSWGATQCSAVNQKCVTNSIVTGVGGAHAIGMAVGASAATMVNAAKHPVKAP